MSEEVHENHNKGTTMKSMSVEEIAKGLPYEKGSIVRSMKSYRVKPELKVEDAADGLVDVVIAVEEARLQAKLQRKIARHKAKLRAIKNGVKPLNGWWSATIDMTPLSLTAVMAAVAGVSALTVSLIPYLS